jgi:hypothetical protein
VRIATGGNWIAPLSQNGQALGLKSILRQPVPSIDRSYRHHMG